MCPQSSSARASLGAGVPPHASAVLHGAASASRVRSRERLRGASVWARTGAPATRVCVWAFPCAAQSACPVRPLSHAAAAAAASSLAGRAGVGVRDGHAGVGQVQVENLPARRQCGRRRARRCGCDRSDPLWQDGTARVSLTTPKVAASTSPGPARRGTRRRNKTSGGGVCQQGFVRGPARAPSCYTSDWLSTAARSPSYCGGAFGEGSRQPQKGEKRKIRSWLGPKVPKIAAARAHTCQNSPCPRVSRRHFTKTFDQADTPLFTWYNTQRRKIKEEDLEKKNSKRRKEEKKERVNGRSVARPTHTLSRMRQPAVSSSFSFSFCPSLAVSLSLSLSLSRALSLCVCTAVCARVEGARSPPATGPRPG